VVFVVLAMAKNVVGVPDGYVAVPIDTDRAGVALRLCVLFKREPEAVAGHFVVLRDSFDSQVLLGCVTDAAGRVHEWVELWIQQVPAAISTAAFADALANTVLDDRWRRRADAWEKVEAPLRRTGWDAAHPPASFIDAQNGALVVPQDPQTREKWVLCEDDALLARKGLAQYGKSLHRYLYLKSKSEESKFIPLTEAAPKNDSTRPLAEVLGAKNRLVDFNEFAGLISVRRYSALSLDAFSEVLSGTSYEGVRQGRAVVDPGNIAQVLHGQDGDSNGSDGWLSISPSTSETFIFEALYLKLRLIADMVNAVRGFVQQSQRPVLELTPESFAVRLGTPGQALPVLWTATVSLADPGDTIPLPLPIAGAQYFASRRGGGPSLYRAPIAGRMLAGSGSVRVPNVVATPEKQLIVDLTLSTQQDLHPTAADLLRFRLNLACGRVDLFARLDPDAARAAGDWRFKSLRHRVDDKVIECLKKAEGIEIPNVTFELLPLLNTPCDLYSLAVIAARTLLVGPGMTLAQAVDKIKSLAAQTASAANERDAGGTLPQRIAAAFARDGQWQQWLGPQNLLRDPQRSEQAPRVVPPALWFDVLAMIIRMLPGAGPERACQNFGDVPTGGIHKVFDRPASDLDALLIRTRSLVVMDTGQNREMRSVISHLLSSMTREPAARRMVTQT
jgi:hypothetical protein